MQMKHGLSGPGTVVDIKSIGIGYSLVNSYPVRHQQQVAQQQPIVLRGIGQHGDRLFWDNQYVDGGLRVDVPEGQAQVILIDYISWDLPVDNLGEQGICHMRQPWH